MKNPRGPSSSERSSDEDGASFVLPAVVCGFAANAKGVSQSFDVAMRSDIVDGGSTDRSSSAGLAIYLFLRRRFGNLDKRLDGRKERIEVKLKGKDKLATDGKSSMAIAFQVQNVQLGLKRSRL